MQSIRFSAFQRLDVQDPSIDLNSSETYSALAVDAFEIIITVGFRGAVSCVLGCGLRGALRIVLRGRRSSMS